MDDQIETLIIESKYNIYNKIRDFRDVIVKETAFVSFEISHKY